MSFNHNQSHTSFTKASTDAPQVLLIDDDESFCLAMSKALRRRGYDVQIITESERSIPILMSPKRPMVALLDLKMPGLNGLEILRRTLHREVPVIMLTGHGAIPEAVEAMRAGAYTFVTKPIDAESLSPLIEQAARQRTEESQHHIAGESEVTKALFKIIDQLAPVGEPVLITGETGTGKEVVARALHSRSARAEEPFVAINMSCLPPNLIESSLFGHVKGSFTGAIQNKMGYFEEVGRGTLFLDEVAELPLEHQAKLLRVIESSEFRPVGASSDQKFVGRLITATHRNLMKEVSEGRFREDLFYRLQVLPLHLSPLRQRPEDIFPILSMWFKKITHNQITLTEETRQALIDYPWYGNAREIVNLTRRIAIFFPEGGEIKQEFIKRMLSVNPFARHLEMTHDFRSEVDESTFKTQETRGVDEGISLGEDVLLETIERVHIERLLNKHKNMSKASRILGINRRTLQRKVKAWGISGAIDDERG